MLGEEGKEKGEETAMASACRLISGSWVAFVIFILHVGGGKNEKGGGRKVGFASGSSYRAAFVTREGGGEEEGEEEGKKSRGPDVCPLPLPFVRTRMKKSNGIVVYFLRGKRGKKKRKGGERRGITQNIWEQCRATLFPRPSISKGERKGGGEEEGGEERKRHRSPVSPPRSAPLSSTIITACAGRGKGGEGRKKIKKKKQRRREEGKKEKRTFAHRRVR